jgi:hypothetical protein
MIQGAKDAPMGWKVMSYRDESTSTEMKGSSPEFQISPMDLVLITSIDPYIARILGHHWVDTSAVDAEVYDYKIVGTWPSEGPSMTLWNLEYIVHFEEEEIGKKFFNVFRKEDY